MATSKSEGEPITPDDSDLPRPQFPAGPPSIISSRMTDIASEDGDAFDERQTSSVSNAQRRSYLATESRPGTAKTGLSSSRGAWSQSTPLRRGVQRGSLSGSISGSVSGRPPSAASRSHVPSLTSHAFFHPMSSQKLQAQRGASRPATTSQQHGTMDEVAAGHVAQQRDSMSSSPVHRIAREPVDDADLEPPPSRGTEMTEQETYDRITANTSPTHGNTAGSLTDSVRPLQRKKPEGPDLSIDVNKAQNKSGANTSVPMKSPRSFRSSLFISKGDSAGNPTNRSMPGAEKLSSGASSPQLTPMATASTSAQNKSIKSKAPNHGKNHEYFEGNTFFCIGGRLQNTRHRPINIATASFVVIPAVLFFVFSAPYLWHEVSPGVPIVFAYIFYICISSFLHASGSDPGILPRNLHQFPPPSENEDPLRLAPPTNDWTLIKSAESSTAAMEVPTKYCKTCNLWRPPRAHHCRLCDNCVETQDHHCVWLNNCVGRRNYRYFFTFVSSGSLLALYLFGASLAQILIYAKKEDVSVGTSISHFRVPFAMVIYGIISSIYPIALMGYHIFLMARGETTREFLNSHKFLKKDRYRPFTQGSMLKNWVAVLCRPRPPTYYQFKGRFERGDQRFAVQKVQRQRMASSHGQDVEMQDVPPSSSGFQGPVALEQERSQQA
ncbi:hypothetical protein PFICI_02925 [Pestalotiopsis fici W106-1]|uniref:Palmitoyltransferase n=1 Tax=Pestalotiopsis fici (strain W106-1 / CGMCC3.15140) TaxID=1229662 RepID=W3XFU2_PESFW|nr:uncharacterized protein PFICI_02925 [Pestalotiopsis fici W106-1]ETS84900.1 hypothetical protein PFICI_02925 [Pestalotiopsis fici W106-1]